MSAFKARPVVRRSFSGTKPHDTVKTGSRRPVVRSAILDDAPFEIQLGRQVRRIENARQGKRTLSRGKGESTPGSDGDPSPSVTAEQNQNNAPPESRPAETSPLSSEDNLSCLISQVRAARQEKAPFKANDDDVRRCLAPGYPLLLAIKDDPAALDSVRSLDELKADRTYRFPKNKPALLVAALVCRPKDRKERSQCSAWSCFYRDAVAKNVPSADFLSWSAERTLKDVKKACAKPRVSSTLRDLAEAEQVRDPDDMWMRLPPTVRAVLAGDTKADAYDACQLALNKLSDFLDDQYDIPVPTRATQDNRRAADHTR